jgi:hypothetical protein
MNARVWSVMSLAMIVFIGCGGEGGTKATAPTDAATSGSSGVTSGASGTGVPGVLALNPPNGNFGNVRVGTRQAIVFTVTNYPTNSAFSATISGTSASDFRLSGGTCFRATRPPTPPASPCTMQVLMTPTSTGAKTATLTVGTNTPANLTGAGVASN